MYNILRYLFVALLFLPLSVRAHGLVTTLSKDTGDYRIEFEYNTFGNIFAGDYTIFDTYLLNKSGESLDYDSAFLRIEKKNGPAIIAGTLSESKDTKGYASLSTQIAEEGPYTASLNFYKNGQQLTSASFDFTVAAKSSTATTKTTSQNPLILVGILVMGIALGIGSSFMLLRKGNK